MKKGFYIVFLFVLSLLVKAQDATFTLIDHNPMSINPAFCLPPNNQIQVMTLSRQQWWNLPGPNAYSAAYHMNNATILMPIQIDRKGGLGAGIQTFSNSSGEGDFSYSGITTTFGYRSELSRKLSMKVGLGMSFKKFSIDWNNLTFSSQLDPFYGYISSIPIVNPRVNSSPDYFTITPNTGINFDWMPTRSVVFTLGGGLHNKLLPIDGSNYTFFGADTRLPQRRTVNLKMVRFLRNTSGLVEDVMSSYIILRHNCEWQSNLKHTETRIGTNIAGALTVYTGYRRREFIPNDLIPGQTTDQDAILYSMQLNLPGFIMSFGYDYTVSGLNIARTRGTTEFGLIVPLGTRGNIKGRRASEPCYVDYLMSHSEWKAVEQFNKKSTSWGRQYSPVTFIR